MEEFVYHGKETALSEALSRELALPYATVRKLLRKKDIKINGTRTAEDVRVRDGDAVTVYLPRRNPLSERVLYEDDQVIVVDKPRRLDTYEAAAMLAERFGEVFPVHRLDRNTNGVLILARTREAETALTRCFKEGRADKRYRALVRGDLSPDEATLTAYLKKDADASHVTVRAQPRAGYQKIVTGYRVLRRFDDCCEVEVRLYTGRTHQIRAHFAFLGHPVVGDGKYGDNAWNRRYGKRFQELTCVSLTLFPDEPLAYLNGKKFAIECSF